MNCENIVAWFERFILIYIFTSFNTIHVQRDTLTYHFVLKCIVQPISRSVTSESSTRLVLFICRDFLLVLFFLSLFFMMVSLSERVAVKFYFVIGESATV